MNRNMRILILAILATGSLPVQAWLDLAPLNGPAPVEGRILGKQLFVPGNATTTIPAINLNRRSKEEHLTLKDGSLYFGKLTGFDPEKGFLWKHPHITPDLRVATGHVKYIQFGNRPTPKNTTGHSCQVTLANGDALSGDLKKLADGTLTLDTWYGGELHLKQSALKTLVPGFTALKNIYQGPQSVRDWNFYDASSGQTHKPLALDSSPEEIGKKAKKISLGTGTWKLNENRFEARYSQARVGRAFENLPDLIRYDFDVQWTGYLNLYVNFLTDNLNSYSSGNAYCLRLNTSYAYLYRYTLKNGVGNGRNVGSNARINLNTLGNHARFSVRVDRKKKSMALFINEKFIKHWNDPQNDGLPDNANGLLFTSMSSNPVTLSQIKLGEWNGKVPGGNHATEKPGDQDFVLFANEDSMSGKLIGIADGKMTFETPFAKLPIPLENITRINLAKNAAEPFTAQSVQAVMRNGQGSITGELVRWADGKLTLKSPYFGEASFDDRIFQSLEFGAKAINTTSRQAVKPTNGLKPVPVRKQIAVPGINPEQLER